MGVILIVLITLLALAATMAAVASADHPALEWTRRMVLGLLVAEAAIGLALALRGATPGESIHWLYGGVVIVVLLLPGTLAPEVAPRVRTGALAVGSAIAAALAWRLWASG